MDSKDAYAAGVKSNIRIVCSAKNVNWNMERIISHASALDLLEKFPKKGWIMRDKTMAEYINKEKFMNYIRDTYGGADQENTCILYYDVIREINEAPIVDACTLLDDIKEELKAMQRLGEFGKLFMNYTGDPRGPIGRRGIGDLEREAHYMEVIKDVDGDRWRPVLEDTLDEILKELPEHVEFEKKVIFYDNTEGVTLWCCPKCNAQITVQKGSTPNESNINYCMHCGVKIDN